ncbi:UBA domain-containing protein [Plasmodiophora brassicae]|uniref:UBA domain-containing protein n=1 Tax=Plasmodiophora brassicae TaxID=37360 RepID=A0A0G4IMZ4_PLABS|nr:hypothetical protein PBRA_005163 [Plasmodiophora brassicae]
MHIRVHTLTGVTTSFELSSTDASLSSLKAVLAEQWSVPVAGQILVLAGKIMSPDSARLDKFLTGGDNIIHNIVVFFSHRRHQSVFHEQLLKDAVGTARIESILHSRREQRRASFEHLRSRRVPVEPSRARLVQVGQSSDIDRPRPPQSPDAAKVRQLEDMGFRADQARRALIHHRNNLELSLNWLLHNSTNNADNDDDDDEDDDDNN